MKFNIINTSYPGNKASERGQASMAFPYINIIFIKVNILHFSDFFGFKSIQQYWINLVCQTQISNGVDRLDPTNHKYLNRMMNLKSNVRNTENSELHRYCHKQMLSLLHQFPFEYVTLKHQQVGDYNSKRALYEFCLC